MSSIGFPGQPLQMISLQAGERGMSASDPDARASPPARQTQAPTATQISVALIGSPVDTTDPEPAGVAPSSGSVGSGPTGWERLWAIEDLLGQSVMTLDGHGQTTPRRGGHGLVGLCQSVHALKGLASGRGGRVRELPW